MIHINNLCFSYTNHSPYILTDLNLVINKGDYVSILGENGSGKSTLIKLILKILKPSKGSITINTDKIGYVPQRLDSFNSQFPITVYEVLNTHRRAIGIKDMSSINKSLDKVGMRDYKNHLIGNLSGGQQQKIFIARALMGNPDLIVLDEPSTGIDIQSQKEIYELIKNLNLKLGVTVISIEHNLKAAILNSNYIFELNDGSGILRSVSEYKRHHKEVISNAAI
ncbi:MULTISPECIES: metal ABC transporter ATP-binding protein [Clostridium]|uniref:High-affinity zinc uptake system ATP-binding protein ZnuC n=2 Tax=Clostridium TaxID=1485 RepID=A0A151AK84_9CLOT|nr:MULTISPECIES: metal ABC transporter ATP-binding protein [Clostridium]KYH27985.1 high-affinity zinc uptake system ATP-binding protein ZnuC [Clostridium colicanis DSM 13634]MBE6045060.1 metal ABC transporter ATP-binding protein [Clostridium thermopalmarium]PRR71623.1 High-affinity zinc uptake system ATP-binding protein ZnuC [Clostridium thermopalmarium DSM 5974]PVZ19408.1 zinc transport system ATP-binding protein [Clostridium thermopalmarium DSM 5974]